MAQTPPASPHPKKKNKTRSKSGDKRKNLFASKISQYRAYSVHDINRHTIQRISTLSSIPLQSISSPVISGSEHEEPKDKAVSDEDSKSKNRNTKFQELDILNKLDILQEVGEKINSRKSLVALGHSDLRGEGKTYKEKVYIDRRTRSVINPTSTMKTITSENHLQKIL